MGWTETHKPKGQSLADFFVEHGVMRWSDESCFAYTILDSALVSACAWYAAVERVEKATGDRTVWAAVILVRMFWSTGPFGFNICFKDGGERDCPVEATCPERLLDLLTPTVDESSLNWRARCRAYHERRKELLKLKTGAKLHFKEPVVFGDGSCSTRELVIRRLERARFICTSPDLLGVKAGLSVSRKFLLGRMEQGAVAFSQP
ncbi:DUF6927 domain-containing protein [Ralstonia pseudosolanacearum]|uniref:DUF6927 domain-containing protein n=1 Tax=Ralstonia pseudosolanacearum TaxID=1310165 RepID=UPI003CF1AFF4